MYVDDLDPTYSGQYSRMIRWYNKYRKINEDFQFENLHEYLDIAYAFFLNCYHLKDWIKNDPTAEISDDDVENHITDNQCLSICADICNGLKHLRLDRPRSDQEPKIGAGELYDTVGSGENSRRVHWYVDTIKGMLDPFELATECVEKWKEFLRRHGLI